MNIGVDFDGVLFDTETMFRAISQIENVKLGRKIVDFEQLMLQKRYDWSKEEIDGFIKKYMFKIHEKSCVMPLAKEVLSVLAKKHKIFGITSRGLLNEEEIKRTNERLALEGIKFDKVFYCSSNKVALCKELKIDIMIEDSHDNVLKIAEEGIKCFYYRDLVLNFVKHKNVVDVRNWGDVAVELEKIGAINVEELNSITNQIWKNN